MITRVWHGRTSVSNADAYLHFLLNKGSKEYLETPGNLTVKVWRKTEENCCHFYTVTEWDTIESIKKFAGENAEKAKYYPEDDNFLLEFEEKVNHYETYLVK